MSFNEFFFFLPSIKFKLFLVDHRPLPSSLFSPPSPLPLVQDTVAFFHFLKNTRLMPTSSSQLCIRYSIFLADS